MMRPDDRRVVRALGSLVALAMLAVGVPWGLLVLSSERFGSGSPWSGVPLPWRWERQRVIDLFEGRVADSTIAEAIVRLSITVVWVAVGLVVATVVVEVVHQVRHDGIPTPHVRGLGWSQAIARFIAAGLLVVVPHLGIVRAAGAPVPFPTPAVAATFATSEAHAHGEHPATFGGPSPASSATPRHGGRVVSGVGEYVVRAGDSVYAIAAHLATDPGAVSQVADEILELNLGNTMADGRRFTNAAYLEVGWVLQIPSVVEVHEVVEGDTLWAISNRHLDDPHRWPEIWEHNAGTEMVDGRTFDDPDVIVPGWRLRMPVDESAQPAGLDAEDRVPNDDVMRPDAVGTEATPDGDGADFDAGDDGDGAGREIVWDSGTGPEFGAETTPELPAPVVLPATPMDFSPATTALETAPSTIAASPVVAIPSAVSGSSSSAPNPGWDGQALEVRRTAPLGLGHAAMLAAGVLTLVAARRRHRLRSAIAGARVPDVAARPAQMERAMSVVDAGERLLRVDLALRTVARAVADRDVAVVAALASRTGEIDVVLSGVAELPSPWSGTTTTWSLPGSISIEELAGAGGGVGAPNVALVHLGVDALERDVFVDLEAIGLLAVDAPAESADLVVRSLASTVASSVFAEVAHLHAVGFDPETFLGHRLGSSRDTLDQALVDAAAHAAPIIACGRSTTALRARATGGEMWEPVIVFALTATSAPVESIPPSRGQAVVVCGAQESAGATLSPNGSSWVLRGPALGHEEIELDPLGLEEDQAVALFELVESASAPLTVDPDPVDTTPVVSSTDPPPVLVRLLGPVQVESATGEPVHFERSKALELVAWLATHRGRATRTAARTALWELDVRDATFANVVSDARRTLARVVPPPDDEEWVGRTMTEELPLHPLVATDAELVEAACARALGRPHDEAIAELERAIELVRGAPFEGTSYLWPDAEGITSNLVLLATSTAVELARHHLEQGDVAGVFRATTAGLLVLPGHEELIALRMRAHARVGDHAGVRQEWESYERVLVGDPWSDGEPAPKLVSLRRELLTPSPAST